MKSFICWTAVVVFLALTMAAINLHEYTIAVVMGLIAFGAMVAAPSGEKKASRRSR